MYVCLSGLGGNVIFWAPILDRALIFCVQIPLVYEPLSYKYCVRRSVVQATKGKNMEMRFSRPPFQYSVLHTYFL